MDKWQIFVKGIQGNTHIFRVEPTCTVDSFMKDASKHYGIAAEELRIIFAGKQLEYGAGKDLADYNINNMSTLFLVLRLRGGLWPKDMLKMKTQLKALPPYISLTSEPDMISWDDDPSYKRAKMPCGHVIGPVSMTSYCQSLLTEGRYRFLCPHVDKATSRRCEREWDYFLVRHVAMLTEEEMSQFETKISENYMFKASGVQKCPGCDSLCMREDKGKNLLQCPICSKTQGRPYIFCWSCLHKCPNSEMCTNRECTGTDPRLQYLHTCDKIVIVGVPNCPSVRACPGCGILINHLAACKHMTCTCRAEFCFICLKQKDAKGQWQCGRYNSKCAVAPVQKTI